MSIFVKILHLPGHRRKYISIFVVMELLLLLEILLLVAVTVSRVPGVDTGAVVIIVAVAIAIAGSFQVFQVCCSVW
jgi:hypothetical protein